MYAVVVTGGKQYKVAEGDRLRVGKAGCPRQWRSGAGAGYCLLVKEDGIVSDSGALGSARVLATVTGEGKRKKIRVLRKSAGKATCAPRATASSSPKSPSGAIRAIGRTFLMAHKKGCVGLLRC